MINEKKEKKHINLLMTIDKNYLYPLIIMLKSYSEVHKDVTTDLYIAHSSLDDEDIKKIEKELNDDNIKIHNIKITNNWFENTPVLERLPKESFYRLMAFDYLPKDIDKCLYLDPDIIIRKSLVSMYNTDISTSYIAASSHLYGLHNYVNKTRLGLRGQDRYINSGVMLMNLRLIRKDFTIDKIFASLNENMQKLLLGDQDLINILFGKKMILLDEKIYNLDERTFKKNKKKFNLKDVESKTAIIHYNGKYKPWLNGYKGVLDKFYPEVENKGPAPTGKIKKQIKSIMNITKATPRQKITLIGVTIVIILWIFIYFFFGKELLKIVSDPILFREWLNKFGAFDEIIFILIRALQTVVKFIPAEPLEIASGYAWGAVLGMVYCVIGNLIGTVIIYALTKKYGKKVIEALMPNKNIDILSLFKESDKVYTLLFFLYLIPGLPKDGFTYFAPFLPVKLVPFMIITGIARMPSVISSTLCGSTLADKQYTLSILIFIGTIVLSVLGVFLYNKYIKYKEGKKTK